MNQNQHQNGNPSPHNVSNENITLTQINEMLNDAGFPIVGPEKVQALQSVAPRERIIRAIRSAKGDPGARTFLQKTFNSAGIPMGDAPDHQNGPMNPPVQTNQNSPTPESSNPAPMGNQSRHAPTSYPSQQSTPQNQNSGQGSGNDKMTADDRVSMHVYGGKAALCFEADMTKQGVPTVALDGALSTAPRQYDWNSKVRLQMTKAELPVIAAVLVGVIPKCEFSSHGPENNKGFSMERQQGGKIFIKVFAKGEQVRSVPVSAPDVFYVTSLVFRQLQKSNPWLDTTALMSLVKATQQGQ
jgi:hypothetical protein